MTCFLSMPMYAIFSNSSPSLSNYALSIMLFYENALCLNIKMLFSTSDFLHLIARAAFECQCASMDFAM